MKESKITYARLLNADGSQTLITKEDDKVIDVQNAPTPTEDKASTSAKREMMGMATATFTGYLVYFILLIVVVVWGMRTQKGVWFYLGGLFLVAPAGGLLVALGTGLVESKMRHAKEAKEAEEAE